MRTSRLATATILALCTAIISGFSNFIAKIGVTAVKDPIVFTTLKNAVVATLLLGVLLAFRKWREIRTLTRRHWVKLVGIGVIGGSLPFALYFTGLTKTSALNASLIHKTLFLWVLLLALPLLKERLSGWQWAGIGLVAAANMLVGGFTGFKFNMGELMILGATVLWAIETIIAKKALKDISSITVASSRMIFGSLALIAFIALRGGGSPISHLSTAQWGWTLLSSALLLGYVLTWYTALKRAPATYIATLLVPATLVTNVLSALFITHAFPLIQIASALCVTAGIALMVVSAQRMHLLPTTPVLPSHPQGSY